VAREGARHGIVTTRRAWRNRAMLHGKMRERAQRA
jgi:hypothetical protein